MRMSTEGGWWVESHDPRYPRDDHFGRITITPCNSKAEAIEVATDLENRGRAIDGIVRTWNAFGVKIRTRSDHRDGVTSETESELARAKPGGMVRLALAVRRALAL